MQSMKKATSRAALMTAALTVMGGAGIAADAHAQQERRGATSQPTAPIEVEEDGSGEGREAGDTASEGQEAEAADPIRCLPGSCPVPLYGVTPLEEL